MKDYYSILGIQKTASEDEVKKHEKELQVLTDDTIKKIDEALAQKEKDIMQV